MNPRMATRQPGHTYGGRFEIEAEAGRGGMATIYAARDRSTRERVALKVLREGARVSSQRFGQEAALLAELRHPAIVRYVDHGVTVSGESYLAMEWLEGQTLEQRLESGPIGLLETLRLGARVLDALAFAHEKGVIHRDLKPSNLFLPGGALTELKLLDFGIARRLRSERLTVAGSALGTPLYMSPEQARGDPALDERSDFFALGAVLVECLTGTSPFAAETSLAVMAKICLEPLDLRAFLSGVPDPVVDVLSQMLAKRPEHRPDRAAVLAREFSKLAVSLAASHPEAVAALPAPVARRPVLTIEQRILSAIVVSPPPSDVEADTTIDDANYRAVAGAIEEFAARVDRFAGGGMLITMLGHGTPTDQATHAARCALKLQILLPQATFAMSTGRAMVGDDLPMGDVIDRAALLLTGGEPGSIAIDLPSCALIERTFEVAPGVGAGQLLFERPAASTLHAATKFEPPCVGRDRELAALVAIVEECVSEPVARAVMVTAPAGGGKSRVCRELVQRLRDGGMKFELLLGRGDSIRAGAPFGMLGPALRGVSGISESEPLAVQQDRLLTMVRRYLPAEVATRVAAFLGEIGRVPFPGDDLPVLRLAREDARVMADQTLLAWLDWIEAACKQGPVMIVLEDLHWGDVPSVQFVDAALRTLRDSPLVVVALSRPDVDERFPGLWAERNLLHISLPPLTPKSCQRLIQQLVPELDSTTTEWIVGRADGNAFYLEELVRAAASGNDVLNLSTMPESVLGMVQARFDALGTYVRRVLRAASVFGETFNAGGVTALVEDSTSIEPALDVLVAREIVVPRPRSGDRSFAFRHALLRDAAYEMLTDEDKRLAHGRAGEFLEARGERNAILLVEHFERGGDLARAAKHCHRAAAQALEGSDLRSAIERVARGVRDGAQGETLGAMRLIEAQARFWCGEYGGQEQAAREAINLTRGPVRLQAASELVAALGQLGRFAEIEAFVAEARAWPEAQHLAAWHALLLRAAGYLPSGGMLELTEALLDEVDDASPSDPAIRGELHRVRGLMWLGTAKLAGAEAQFQKAVVAFEEAGDVRFSVAARCDGAAAIGSLGRLKEVEPRLRELVTVVDRMNLQCLYMMTIHNLGSVLADLGALDEGRALVERSLSGARRQGDPRVEGYCLTTLGVIATRARNFEAAESHARAAMASTVASLRPLAVAVLAGALLGQRRVDEALEQAREANRLLDEQGYVEDGEALVRLSLVECLLAAGDTNAARECAERAYHRLVDRAAAIDEVQWRTSFLDSLPNHRRTVEIARSFGLSREAV
jgi:tetratricopeptide (TPR) repeat protein